MRREKPARASFTSTSSRACKHCSTIPRASRRSRTVISTLKVTNIQQAYAMSSTVMSTRNLLEREVDQRSSFRTSVFQPAPTAPQGLQTPTSTQHLRPGPISNEEKAQRRLHNLCMYCGNPTHTTDVEENKIGVKYFADKRDIALAFTSDGFRPRDNRSATCWPSILFNLNLPPDVKD